MLLQADGLDVFHGDIQALWGVSLQVEDGECVAVLGANGAGKTTLLSTIAGLLKPASGTVYFDDEPLHVMPAHQVCAHGLALVPEGGQLFPEMTVRENLELGAYTTRARRSASSNLRRQFEFFPRLAERGQVPAGALSGGERQLLAIARALMSEPRLLMLDEPSLGLSPVAVEHIFEVLARLRQSGLTVLIVEQNVSHALDLADRVYLLESGRLVREGSAAAFEDDPDIRRHFLGI